MTEPTTAPADCGLRGLALLDAAIAQIEAHPETWEQGTWRCESGMCVAGWTATLAGGEWAYPPNAEGSKSAFLVPVPGDSARDIRNTSHGPAVFARFRAARLLGLFDAFPLIFEPENDLAEIRRLRDEMVNLGEIR